MMSKFMNKIWYPLKNKWEEVFSGHDYLGPPIRSFILELEKLCNEEERADLLLSLLYLQKVGNAHSANSYLAHWELDHHPFLDRVDALGVMGVCFCEMRLIRDFSSKKIDFDSPRMFWEMMGYNNTAFYDIFPPPDDCRGFDQAVRNRAVFWWATSLCHLLVNNDDNGLVPIDYSTNSEFWEDVLPEKSWIRRCLELVDFKNQAVPFIDRSDIWEVEFNPNKKKRDAKINLPKVGATTEEYAKFGVSVLLKSRLNSLLKKYSAEVDLIACKHVDSYEYLGGCKSIMGIIASVAEEVSEISSDLDEELVKILAVASVQSLLERQGFLIARFDKIFKTNINNEAGDLYCYGKR